MEWPVAVSHEHPLSSSRRTTGHSKAWVGCDETWPKWPHEWSSGFSIELSHCRKRLGYLRNGQKASVSKGLVETSWGWRGSQDHCRPSWLCSEPEFHSKCDRCHCRLVSYITSVPFWWGMLIMGEATRVWGQGLYGRSLLLFSPFWCKPEIALQKYNLLKKWLETKSYIKETDTSLTMWWNDTATTLTKEQLILVHIFKMHGSGKWVSGARMVAWRCQEAKGMVAQGRVTSGDGRTWADLTFFLEISNQKYPH